MAIEEARKIREAVAATPERETELASPQAAAAPGSEA
jgi:hypothetical protein